MTDFLAQGLIHVHANGCLMAGFPVQQLLIDLIYGWFPCPSKPYKSFAFPMADACAHRITYPFKSPSRHIRSQGWLGGDLSYIRTHAGRWLVVWQIWLTGCSKSHLLMGKVSERFNRVSSDTARHFSSKLFPSFVLPCVYSAIWLVHTTPDLFCAT